MENGKLMKKHLNKRSQLVLYTVFFYNPDFFCFFFYVINLLIM